MRNVCLLVVFAVLGAPGAALAWWNDDWSGRQKITLDATPAGADLKQELVNVPVLVRLSTGKFDFLAAREDGADIRLVAGDDKLPLPFHVESYDPLNEMALVWVQVPKLAPGAKTDIWLYYGNQAAPSASDPKATWDANHTLVLHFADRDGQFRDATAYNHALTQEGVVASPSGLIGNGALFNGASRVTVAAVPALRIAPPGGFTFSAWVKPGEGNTEAALFRQQEGDNALVVGVDAQGLYARFGTAETARVPFPPGAWQHVAVTWSDRLVVYLNGVESAAAPAAVAELGGDLVVGERFSGEMDEVRLSNVARSPAWLRTATVGEGLEAKLVTYVAAEGGGGGEANYLVILVDALTLDGKIVIIILLVMLVISFGVMIMKAIFVSRTDAANREFLENFQKLTGDLAGLDRGDVTDDEGEELESAEALGSMKHSSLYRLYHQGMRELRHRFEIYDQRKMARNLTPQAIDAIRAAMDTVMVRERHRLDSQMVLLTIAISGGPFLGLLGTVVGVMITFAAVAAAGDVNINAIAPGIAAALLATVAGLAVAIPALFGYNYLASRIKTIVADMQVFADELLTKMAESYSA
jgi:biopolymer transport protein ExbB